MAGRTDCYVDTSALIAFLDRSDSHHALFRRLFASPPALIGSALVIAEGHGWFLRRYDMRRAVQFLNFVREIPNFTIAAFDDAALAAAGMVIRKYADQPLTLCDAHGLALMTERRIRCCWSTDRHMGLTGVPLII